MTTTTTRQRRPTCGDFYSTTIPLFLQTTIRYTYDYSTIIVSCLAPNPCPLSLQVPANEFKERSIGTSCNTTISLYVYTNIIL